jgi:hypothetical protein
MNYEAWVLEALLAFPLVTAIAVLLRPVREAKWIALSPRSRCRWPC